MAYASTNGGIVWRDYKTIRKHINNALKEELDNSTVANFATVGKEVCAKFAHTTKHGALSDKTQTRELDYYNLDMIISGG